jgi:hypothetical protein
MKRIISAAAATAIALAALTGCTTDAAEPAAKPTADAQAEATTPSEPVEVGFAVDAATLEWASTTFPVFDRVTIAGFGNGQIDIPEQARIGALTFTTDASDVSANIMAVAADGSPGGGSGTGATFTTTLTSPEGVTPAPVMLVSAVGAWSLVLFPIKDLPALELSGSGTGSYLFSGPATTFSIVKDEGEFPLYMNQLTEIGEISWQEEGATTVDVLASPSIVKVSGHAAWEIAEQ